MTFFIFVVCNCGGCLLPIGDPPLFLGYLEGVDFLWTMKALWLPWLVVNAVVICVYLVWDNVLYRKEKVRDIRRDETRIRPLRIFGLWPQYPAAGRCYPRGRAAGSEKNVSGHAVASARFRAGGAAIGPGNPFLDVGVPHAADGN